MVTRWGERASKRRSEVDGGMRVVDRPRPVGEEARYRSERLHRHTWRSQGCSHLVDERQKSGEAIRDSLYRPAVSSLLVQGDVQKAHQTVGHRLASSIVAEVNRVGL